MVYDASRQSFPAERIASPPPPAPAATPKSARIHPPAMPASTATDTPTDANGMRERIRSAAIDLFAAKGFHGTSVRDLAQAVGIEAASLYYHFPSKQDLLLSLFDQIMDDLLDRMRTASGGAGDPLQRLVAVLRGHVLYHIAHRKEAFVSHSELRSLTPSNRRLIVAKRDRYEKALRELLEAGVASGDFHVDDVPVTATTLLVMCSGVSDWIQPRGRLGADDVAALYTTMVLRLVGAESQGAAPKTRSARR